MFSLLRLCFVCEIYVKNAGVAVFVSVAMSIYSFALYAAKVPLGQCSSVRLQ